MPGYLGYLGLTAFMLVIITYRISGAQVAAAIATGAVAIGVMSGSLQFSKVRLEALLIAAVYVVALLSVPEALDSDRASGRLGELMKVVLIYLVAVHTLTSTNRIVTLAGLWCVAYLLFPIRGTIVNYFLVGYRMEGRAIWNYVYQNPNDLAALTMITATLGMALFFTLRRPVHRKSVLAGIVASGLIILLSGSRGVMIGTAVAMAVFLWDRRRNTKTLLLFAAFGLAAIVFAPDVVRERMRTIGEDPGADWVREVDDGSMKERLAVWETALEIVRDYPVFGVGIGSFSKANYEYGARKDEVFGLAGAPTQDAHSTYLTVWTELGTIGLLLYLMFFAASWYRVFRTKQMAKRARRTDLAIPLAALEAGVLGYFVACLFASYEALTLPYLFLAVCASWCMVVRHQLPKRGSGRVDNARTSTRFVTQATPVTPQIVS